MRIIILDRNKQYFVEKNVRLKIDFLPGIVGKILVFDKILFFDDGKNVFFGNPFISNKLLKMKIFSHIRDKKVDVLKFKRRKNYLKRYGHRQKYTFLDFVSFDSI